MNISTSLFNGPELNTANTYQPLSDITSEDDSYDFTLGSDKSPGPPMHSSSPNKPTRPNNTKKRQSLLIVNVNCQSIKAKKEPFNIMVNRIKPDIIVGTESWLHDEIGNSECFPVEVYEILRRDCTTEPPDHHGGVFIATKKDLIMDREIELETDCEILWAKINIKGSKVLHVGAYYRPNEGDENSLDQLEASLLRIGNRDENILLAGDFNFPGWDWKESKLKHCNQPNLHYRFGEILDDRGLVQLVDQPTRARNTLDLVITNTPSKVITVDVIPGVSDHDCPLVELDVKPIRRLQKPRKVPMYKKARWDTLASEMKEVGDDIIRLAPTTTVNILWSMFQKAIKEGIERHIPCKTLKNKDSLPYITNEIERLIKRRDRHYKRRKRMQKNFEHSSVTYQNQDSKIRDIKREIQKKTRRAFWAHIESIITPMENEEDQYSGMKRFWSFIKHRKKDHEGVAPLKHEGQTHTGHKEKASILNQQFESVFIRETPISPDLLPEQPSHPSMEDIVITEPGVQKLLERLKVHKAAGPDQIGPRVLKELAETIAPILTVIFKRSYDTGEVPDEWRTANVIPIYKKGKKNEASNYRPISLTCISCKLLEHIITSSIMSHANTHSILYSLQHGFRSMRSCETQLLEFIADIANTTQKGAQTDILIMDFSKAFDKVGHARLVRKLHHYGIQGKTNKWIKSFLANRTQTVVLEGERSDEAIVTSGVPQGSVLGPCLFLFYINDIPNNISSRVRLFADDTVMYLTIRSTRDGNTLQSDLQKLGEWERTWQMEFHPGKCQVLSITRNKNIIKHEYSLHGNKLEHVDTAKYLGVTLSHDLRWNQHITNITNKANRSLGFLRRNLQINNPQLKATAYKTLVRPSVEYAASVWDPYTITNIRKIEMVQRRAARFTLNRFRNRSSVSSMIEQLGWTSLEERRKHQRLTMLYKIRNGLVAVDGTQYLTSVQRPTRHNHDQALIVPQSSTDYHRFSFFPRTVREWNALPAATVNASSLNMFRRRIVAERE